jgi:hypothetical protein
MDKIQAGTISAEGLQTLAAEVLVEATLLLLKINHGQLSLFITSIGFIISLLVSSKGQLRFPHFIPLIILSAHGICMFSYINTWAFTVMMISHRVFGAE